MGDTEQDKLLFYSGYVGYRLAEKPYFYENQSSARIVSLALFSDSLEPECPGP